MTTQEKLDKIEQIVYDAINNEDGFKEAPLVLIEIYEFIQENK